MLRIKGKTIKEQLADLKKDPALALTTGRPIDPVERKGPVSRHPGLRGKKAPTTEKVSKDESTPTKSKGTAKKARTNV
jgi:hypothetical protein